jgi:hypothetical protein
MQKTGRQFSMQPMKRAKTHSPADQPNAKPNTAPPTKAPNPAAANRPNPRLQADARWQRTQRYGWDKGGSRGGR